MNIIRMYRDYRDNDGVSYMNIINHNIIGFHLPDFDQGNRLIMGEMAIYNILRMCE